MAADRGERNLSGVEELGGVCTCHCADEHPVCDAGDEIADAFLSGERRDSAAIVLAGDESGVNPVVFFSHSLVEGA